MRTNNLIRLKFPLNLGHKDSNLGITEPKPAALPLGYAPFFAFIMKSLCEKVNNYSKIDFFIKERK
jgi:hypothetical protein|tara:strand:- start:18 stop:215 length:198 start_codon:yes stop_codon:yes gene_type:complete